jgi:hypothetical protein
MGHREGREVSSEWWASGRSTHLSLLGEDFPLFPFRVPSGAEDVYQQIGESVEYDPEQQLEKELDHASPARKNGWSIRIRVTLFCSTPPALPGIPCLEAKHDQKCKKIQEGKSHAAKDATDLTNSQ